jgi:hypothetical protein
VKQQTINYKDLVVGVSGVATASFSLYNAYDNVLDGTVAVNKANLMVKTTLDSVEGAQLKYNNTVVKYGPASAEAAASAKDLQLAEERHTLAVERADMVQGNYNEKIVASALSVVPTMITMVSSLATVKGILTGVTNANTIAEGVGTATKSASIPATIAATAAQWGLNSALLANPITWVVLAIVGLVAALILAYNYCKPFKDAVDGLAKGLMEGLKVAIDVVMKALTWLWENVLAPLGKFISDVFMATINSLIGGLRAICDALKPVGDFFGWVASKVGDAINSIGKSIEDYQDMVKAAEDSTKNGLSVMSNLYINKYDEMSNTVDVALSKQVTEITAKFDEMISAQKAAYDVDLKALTEFWDKKLTITVSELDTINGKITDFYDKQIKEIKESSQAQIDVAQSAYDKQLTDFSDFWEKKLGKQTTELTKIESDIASFYDKQISDIQTASAEQIEILNSAYAQELTDFTSFWTSKFSVQATELSEIESTIKDFYSKQIEGVKAFYQTDIDAATEAYTKKVSDLTDYYNTAYGTTTTEFDKIRDVITSHFDAEASETKAYYDDKISATNTLYDSLLTSTNAGLAALRGANQQANDDNELLMLEEKVSIQQAYAAGLISEKIYTAQLSDLSKTYNAQRTISNDAFRLEELRLEKTAKEAGVSIEAQRAAELATISKNSAVALTQQEQSKFDAINAAFTQYQTVVVDGQTVLTNKVAAIKQTESAIIKNFETAKNNDLFDAQNSYAVITGENAQTLASNIAAVKASEAEQVKALETQKNATLQEAQTQYYAIATVAFEKLTAFITATKQKESTDVNVIEKQKNADLQAAAVQFMSLEADNASKLIQLNLDKANAIANAEKAAGEEKRAYLQTLEDQINSNMSLSAEQKKQIIADMNAACLADTQTQWTNIADTIQAAMDKITGQNIVFKAALESGKITASEYQAAMEFQNTQANKLAEQAAINQQNAVFAEALRTKKITQTQYNAAMAVQTQKLAALGLAEGGIVDSPTLALIGEAGPEKVVPLNKFNSGSETSNQTYVFSPNITVTVEPGAVQNPRQMARELLDEMNSLIRNDMKSKTFFTQG